MMRVIISGCSWSALFIPVNVFLIFAQFRPGAKLCFAPPETADIDRAVLIRGNFSNIRDSPAYR